MECPHIAKAVCLDMGKIKGHGGRFCCSVCRTHKSPWFCLTCGEIHCGRYVNGHAKSHFEVNRTHCIAVDPSLVAFCYECDDNVINDTPEGRLQRVREALLDREQQTGGEPPRKLAKVEDEVRPKLAGLRNLGNTCFINSVLQSLSNIQDFCCYFRRLPTMPARANAVKRAQYQTRSSNGEDVCLVEEMRKLLNSLSEATTPVSPDSLFTMLWKVAPCFRGYQQQDAHEFMRYLLDRLHVELQAMVNCKNSDSNAHSKTIIHRVFGGLLRNEVNCMVCGNESVKQDPFLDLSLGIPERFVQRRSKSKDSCQCSVQDCLSHFCDKEELEESERYVCEQCGKRQRSTKKFWLRQLPLVLCLHLKRFRYTSMLRSKLDLSVQFPLEGLDLSDYLMPGQPCSESCLYDLAAVVVHHGSGVGSGHYTAYVFSSKADGWFHFNDSTVTRTTADAVAACKAYILFYIRRDATKMDVS